MTGFIAYVFPYPNRVSFKEAFGVLEPDDGKLSRPVLRGPGLSDGVRLLDPLHTSCEKLPHRNFSGFSQRDFRAAKGHSHQSDASLPSTYGKS